MVKYIISVFWGGIMYAEFVFGEKRTLYTSIDWFSRNVLYKKKLDAASFYIVGNDKFFVIMLFIKCGASPLKDPEFQKASCR